jgi:hypothetical protein
MRTTFLPDYETVAQTLAESDILAVMDGGGTRVHVAHRQGSNIYIYESLRDGSAFVFEPSEDGESDHDHARRIRDGNR